MGGSRERSYVFVFWGAARQMELLYLRQRHSRKEDKQGLGPCSPGFLPDMRV